MSHRDGRLCDQGSPLEPHLFTPGNMPGMITPDSPCGTPDPTITPDGCTQVPSTGLEPSVVTKSTLQAQGLLTGVSVSSRSRRLSKLVLGKSKL